MRINNTEFNCSLSDIIKELQSQLEANRIPLLQKTFETNTHIQVSCPYHKGGQERRPSAGIRKSDGMFHCFSCGEVHNLPEVVTYCFGNNDILGKFGWNWLLKNFATIQIEERKDVELDYKRNRHRSNLADIVRVNSVCNNNHNMVEDNKGFILESELKRYRYTHPYWKKRGITSEHIIELFDLGYDKETDCITFPIRDIQGNCLFVARRSVKSKYFNYPKGVEKPLYGLYELWIEYNEPKEITHRLNEVIVCESMIDALTCWQHGKYAVALNGLGNERQFIQLRELPCRELVLATDNDNAGMVARKKLRKRVTNKIITEYMLPSDKKDLNDLSKEEFLQLKKVF